VDRRPIPSYIRLDRVRDTSQLSSSRRGSGSRLDGRGGPYSVAPVKELARRGARVLAAVPDVSIVIPVLRRTDLAGPCLDSLSRLTTPPTFEVIVVANGSPDTAIAELSRRDDIVLVTSGVNLGFAGGCNWGARFARGRHLVLLNDDTEVEDGWLRALVQLVETDPGIGAVGSRILGFDGTLQEAGSVLWRDGGTYQVGRGLPPGTGLHTSVRAVDYSSACGLLVRMSAWREVGGFDDAYFPAYHEDVDLCLALRAAGYGVLYSPDARLRHHQGASAADVPLLTFAALRNGMYFCAKWAATLDEYDVAPKPRSIDAAVEAAVRHGAERRPPARTPAPAAGEDLEPPTEREGLARQIQALQNQSRLKDAFIAHLQEDLRRSRQPRATLEHLRPLARRIRHVIRRAGAAAGVRGVADRRGVSTPPPEP